VTRFHSLRTVVALGALGVLARVAAADDAPAPDPETIEMPAESAADPATEPAPQAPSTRVAAAGEEPAVVATEPRPETGEDTGPWVKPFAAVVGGMEVETLQTRPGDDREGRLVTIALSRFGIRARIAKGVSLESELEANAGPHGTSAWEGQAALSVRNQLVRYERAGFRIDAGRVTDPSSIDYVSAHAGDQLYTDGFTRGQLLASGFNRGNGIVARYRVAPPIELGFALNAANPVSTTSSLIVGGTFPPFARFYFAPYQYVGRDAANFPADEFHIVVVTPSAKLNLPNVELQGALQMLKVDTNMSSTTDQNIDGMNLRLGAVSTLARGMVRAFANASLVQNEVVDPDDGMRLSGEVFTGWTASGGVDVNPVPWLGGGISAAWIHDHQGDRDLAEQYFLNLGATWWLATKTAVGARFGLYRRCEYDADGACVTDGERSLFLTLRTEI
jgi:hypothetical protein